MNYKIIGKYIKELNFKIPDAETFSLLSKDISNYRIKVDIKSKQIKERVLEIETKLCLEPINDKQKKIDTTIIYAAIVELSKSLTDKKNIEKVVLIDVPSEIYPELRRSFIFLFEKSGFKDIKISEQINFEKLYKAKEN
tara:strand:+ start:36 stop:452 length:417 start_codon:yes stop_codon:yes gene_type:complete